MIKYVFKEAPLTIRNAEEADAQQIGEALAEIAKKNDGHLRTVDVWEEAKNKRHVLHRHIEWDKDKAARAYQMEQVRCIIRCVRVDDPGAEEGNPPAFISISDRAGTSYRGLHAIRESVDLQARVLEQAKRDLEAWTKRYRSLREVCEIVQSAQNALDERIAAQSKKGGRKAKDAPASPPG